ncbi:hypothetical protein JFT33_15195 [Pseudomonas carnis]|uniref:hypothetical protein n=1 Tax=Pseudomonas carnis TaxID=2487355 RepID=UPI0018E73472|nr:hypothetical protein [Pseudomonas carnis]MBJ2207935.1 hypothetical protein [Pseudomonas carnis]
MTRDVHDVDEHPVAVFVHAGEGCKKALTATAAIECLKKTPWKSTYPPPADALRVHFYCKHRCSENHPPAQAGRGASQAIVNFILCKVLKENDKPLHRLRPLQGGVSEKGTDLNGTYLTANRLI